jgi:hypothetical protein
MATADKSNLFSNLFRDIGKPGGSIAPTTMLAIAILVLLGFVAGAFFLHSRIDKLHSRLDKLETDLAIAKGDLESTNERLMSLQREISQIRQDQSSAAATIARLDNRSSATAQPTSPQNTAQPTSPENNVLQITAVEAKLIREFLMKIDAFKPRVADGLKVGDRIPEDRLLDFSAVLTQGVPKLKNTSYTIDQTGSIIIVSENRIVAILDFVNVAR